MFITEERKKIVAFTDPYYLAAITHVVPKSSDIKEFTADSLKGKIIGVQSGTTHASYIEQAFPDAEIRLYPTQDEVNLDMASGRLDVTVGDILPMLDWTKKVKDGECCELRGEPVTDPKYVGDGVGIALRQEDEELRKRLNKALNEILEDGTYKAINNKYFDVNIYTMK